MIALGPSSGQSNASGKQHVSIERLCDDLNRTGQSFDSWLPTVVSPEMQSIDLPGDWVGRYGSTQEAMMRDLQEILTQQSGRSIRIHEDTEKQIETTFALDTNALDTNALDTNAGATAVSGRETTQPVDASQAPVIDIYSKEADLTDRTRISKPMSLDALMHQLAAMYHRPIRCEDGGTPLIRMRLHPAAWRAISSVPTADDNAFVMSVLNNVAKQLGMRLRNSIEQRPVYRIQ